MNDFVSDPRQLSLDGFIACAAGNGLGSHTNNSVRSPAGQPSASSLLTTELLRSWVDEFRTLHNGKFPTNYSGPIASSDTTWCAVNAAMSKGKRGWSPAMTLAAWLAQEYVAYPKKEQSERLSVDRLRMWTDAFRQANDGKFPTLHSGNIPFTKTNWNAVHAAMCKGHSGWTTKMTLVTWFGQEYADYPKKRNTETLTPAILRRWTDAFRNANDGGFPQINSGPIPGTSSDWKSVAVSMLHGRRGWNQKISLPAWLDQEYFEIRSRKRIGLVTTEQIRGWVTDFRNSNGGQFPASSSGQIPGTKWTWKLLDNWLRTMSVDQPVKNSVLKWLIKEFPEYRGHRIRENLDPALIKRWATEYGAAHNGKLPGQASGPIPGTNLTWRKIDFAMAHGLRGWKEKVSLSVWLRRELPLDHS